MQNPVPVLSAQRNSFCMHVCVCARTPTHRQEKQSRLLILRCATSHLRRGRKQHCPNQGPASMEIISRKDTAARKHILCSQLLLFPQTEHPHEVLVSESSTLLNSSWAVLPPKPPCPAAESPLGIFSPLSLGWFFFGGGGGEGWEDLHKMIKLPKGNQSKPKARLQT